MVLGTWRTTPIEKSDTHKSWHTFDRAGLCLSCGYYCVDCPISVATCKCDGSQERADFRLKQENSGVTDSWG